MMRLRSVRRGMTLVEIMIALVLLGIVSGVIMRVVTRQQRFYQGVNQIMTQRGQLRQGITVLPVDLRSLSSIGDDLIAVSDSAIEFDMNIGMGVVCAVGSGSTIWLPPRASASGATLFTTAPGIKLEDDAQVARGVTVYVYNDSSTTGNFDDRWQKFAMSAALDSSTAQCTSLSSFASAADAGKYRYKLTLADTTGASDAATAGPISRYIGVGAPVRIMKRVRYKLYQESDAKWYLGYSDFSKAANAYDALTPVSGPYDSYATGSGSAPGFRFRYFDVDGVEIASGASQAERRRIARVDIIARARTTGNVRAAGIQAGASQQYRDSLAVSVMVRTRQ